MKLTVTNLDIISSHESGYVEYTLIRGEKKVKSMFVQELVLLNAKVTTGKLTDSASRLCYRCLLQIEGVII